MAKTPENPSEVVDYGNAGMEEAKRRIEAKKNAKELPDVKSVVDHPCKVWGLSWFYSGRWLTWWVNELDCPWGGQWRFESYDKKVIVDWEWFWGQNLWGFKSWTVTVDWKNFNVTKTYWIKRVNLATLEWNATAGGKYKYNFEMGPDFKLKNITYKWVTLKLSYDSDWTTYLEGSHGAKLKLSKGEEDLGACRIAHIIDQVRWAKKYNQNLEHFETNRGDNSVQADYYERDWDVDIVENLYTKCWISATSAVNWLNKVRWDFGI